MATKIIQFLLLLLYISVPSSGSVQLSYPAIFNFGDSNSDTGNIIAGLGFNLYPPYGQNHFGNHTGRFSDGRLILDFLMSAMDLPLLSAYLDSIGPTNFHTGCNFAASGATIHPSTADAFCPFSFGIQVAQFLSFKARALTLLSQSKKFDEYLPAEEYFHKGLYMFDIGQNDLDPVLISGSYDEMLALISAYMEIFEAGIQRLYEEGARNYWIHNTGPFGCLALNIANFGTAKSEVDEFGCLQTFNQAAMAFNQRLRDLCHRLEGQYADINITYVDIFAIKSDLIRNYSQYGFEEPIMACCGYGGPPLNSDSRVFCGTTSVVNGSSVAAKGCSDSTKYVSWDGGHYTEAANQHVAEHILTGKYTNPPFFDMLPFLGAFEA